MTTLEASVERHEKDLYYGNGRPGITTRISMNEDMVQRIDRNLSKITWMLLAVLLTGAVDVVLRGVHL